MATWRFLSDKGIAEAVECTGVGMHNCGALVFFNDIHMQHGFRIVAPGHWIDAQRTDEGPEASRVLQH